MQLILDADNIDIQRNMSTIEKEPLSDKFLTNNVIDHLADITTGNKENIQKQENIILDVGEVNDIETDKEIPPSDPEILATSINVKKTNEDNIHSEDDEAPDNIIDDKIKNCLEQVPDELKIENANKDETFRELSETKLDELNNTEAANIELREENGTDLVLLDKNPTVDDTANKNDIMEISTEPNKENETEFDKEVDISELSTELNEEKQMDLDKEDIGESCRINEDNDVRTDDNLNVVPEKELVKDLFENEVPSTCLNDKIPKVDCLEIEPMQINETYEKITAIEIDDEEEKNSVKSPPSDQNVQEVSQNENKSDEGEVIEEIDKSTLDDTLSKEPLEEPVEPKRICRLSNNLDIFSDEEDNHPDEEIPKDNIQPITEKQCINIDDDDDIMLIDEDSGTKDSEKKDAILEVEAVNSVTSKAQSPPENTNQAKNEIDDAESTQNQKVTETMEKNESNIPDDKGTIATKNETFDTPVIETNKIDVDNPEDTEKLKKPLLPKNFINTCKKNLSEMTRNDLEEFCILKIVESIVDRSNLGEIKTHLKNLTQSMEECKIKCLILSKQNKDLQVVLKSVQEEQKSGSGLHITPLKITRSVGMQVVMVADKGNNLRKKPVNGVGAQAPITNNNTKQVKTPQTQNTKNQKEKAPMTQQIPVPRLVPATSPVVKTNQTTINNTAAKQLNNTTLPNGVRYSPPMVKVPEKRTRSQAVTVDLTEDEPPAKLQNVQRGAANQPIRVLTTASNLVPAQRFNQNMNSPRKVYIPISGPQAQNVRPGQTIMLKTLSGLGPRPRAPAQALITKNPQTPTPVRFGRGQPNRHPAPLPDAMKQYQPPNWKSLPPAPDLKLSKVENGIVISWKIDGYQEDNHEEIASYQLYAYQETSSPPNTTLWKKIGDVKALPLPMACTLTQFMAGYKYYFAVRAVDIRSRFGPFSLPGSILLLNKM